MVGAIIDATHRVIATRGLAGVTTTQVAAVAGVSVGTLYQYFPSKAALLAAWEQRTMRALLEDLRQHVAAVAGLPIRERVPIIARRAIDGVVRLALLYRFDAEADVQFASRTDERLQLAGVCAEFLALELASYRASIGPHDLRLAATMVVKTGVTMGFVYAAEHPQEVVSGAFQHELATMIARYLLADE